MDRSAGQSQSFGSSQGAAGLAGFDQDAIRAMLDADRQAAEASIAAATGTPVSEVSPISSAEFTSAPAPVDFDSAASASATELAPTPQPAASKSPAPDSDDLPPSGATPVRSAKDAINAMYASAPDKRLSSYLASTAKEIINASGEKPSSDSKSAASLHHQSGRRKMESTRPSASALFRMAKSKSERTPPPRPTTNAADPLLEVEPPVVVKRSAPKPSDVVPVVHTSLKLAPKKPPIVIKPKATAPAPTRSVDGSSRVRNNLRPAKGQIAINAAKPAAPIIKSTASSAASTNAVAKSSPATKKVAISTISAEASQTAKTVASIQRAAATALKSNDPATRPKSRGRMMDVAPRPGQAPSAHGLSGPNSAAHSQASASQGLPAASSPRGSHTSAARSAKTTSSQSAPGESAYTTRASKSVAKPFRSVKERFRPAPKGYSAARPSDARAEVFADFSNPDHPIKAQHLSLPAPSSVDIYSEIDASVPAARAQSQKNAEVGLGVVQDYRPQGDRVENSHFTESTIAGGHGSAASSTANTSTATNQNSAAPDNNRYALGGQSPFFIKTVQVEKRPLSDGPKRSKSTETTGTVYAAPQYDDPKGKNAYDKKSTKKTKSKTKAKPAKVDKKALRQNIPARPTVIVPPSRRSHAPLFFLLLATIILGAAVGALSYLCFFQ